MAKESLTAEQLKEAKALDQLLQRLTTISDEMKQYKLGDIYILEEWCRDNPKSISVHKTYTGYPAKYKVVFISPEGIPYLRQLTSTGNPTGEICLPPEIPMLTVLKHLDVIAANAISSYNQQRFVPDPEQLDAILLQQEFDPMAQHRDKSKLFGEINKHNKSVQIPTDYFSFNKIASFFKSQKAGDKFWTSPDKQFVVQSVVKAGREWVITATDMNQATVTFNFSSFRNKRLYKEQPRSFAKESKT
jgi:hypothetical protein